MGISVSLLALACATGVEEEPPPGHIGGDDAGANLPQDGGDEDGGEDAGPSGDAGGKGCPSTMVRIPAAGGAYCIDATEVTNESYAKFLGTSPSTEGQVAGCQWNDSFEPGSWPAASGEEKHPVVEVDWCDAHAFCAWAGKSLCGRIGGGALLFADYDDPKRSQWFNACSAEGTRKYPYGSEYEKTRCNGLDNEANGSVNVGSMDCEGGTSGLFDMSGNVQEWEASCDGATGAVDRCRIRGGSYGENQQTLECSYPHEAPRGAKLPRIGIRCCLD